jgi:RHS repeat-associated protein
MTAEKEGGTLLNLQYEYDQTGNILELTTTIQNPVTHLQETTSEFYSYDALDQVLSASNGYGSISFSYDAAGNRVQKILNGTLEQYTYLLYDRLETAGLWSFSYDGNGNTLSKSNDYDEWVYQYDSADRLIEVKRNSEIIGEYMYNGNGQRIKKTEWNENSQQYETTIYVYSQGNIHFEKNLTTGMDALYMYGKTGRIAKKVGEEIMYYHTDHLKSTRLVTDTTGNPLTSVEYYPFGHVSESVGQKEQYLFTGQEKDATGLYYFKARYYDPEIGRFLTRDKWRGNYKRPQTLNKYVYCMNNPLRYSDPTGNVPATGDPDMDALLYSLEDGESDDQSDDEDLKNKSDAFKTGYALSAAVNCQWHLDLATNISQKSRKTKEAFAMELFPGEDQAEERKDFCDGWEKGERRGEKKAIDVVLNNVEKDIGEMQQCVKGLIKEVSEKIAMDVGVGLLIPTELAAMTYVKDNWDALAAGEIPPSYELEKFCQPEEEEGSCSGTILIVICLGLGIMISMSQKRGGRYEF